MGAKIIEYWKPDNVTFNQIQQLKKLVNFITQFEIFNKKDQQIAEEIKYLIENINNPSTYKNWNICLDIFDRAIQSGTNKQGGFYWRKWAVYFEDNSLNIEAVSNHTEDLLGHYGDDFYYFANISLKKELKGKQIYLNTPIAEFVKDAIQYQKYITATLNDVDIDLDVEKIK